MHLYRIICTANGKSYIGVTSRGLVSRLRRHCYDARAQRKEGSALHAAIRRYGAGAFSIEKIGEALDWPSLLAMERAAIALYATFVPTGYNLTLGGEGMLGLVKSEDTRRKIAAGNTGKRHTAEHRAKISAAHKGKIVSAESRAKQSAARRGMRFTEEHRAALAASHKGKSPSPEHMERLRLLALGRACKPETRGKIGAAQKGKAPNWDAINRAAAKNRGRKLTDEHKAKIGRRGAAHGMARVSETDVLAIRAARAAGETLKSIGGRYGVTLHAIWRIVKGKAWAHLPLHAETNSPGTPT